VKRWILIILGAVVLLAIIAFVYGMNGLGEGAAVRLAGVDASALPDGKYTGTYSHGRWTNTLTVSVEDGQMVGIDMDRDIVIKMPDCTEEMFRRVLEAQDTRVDVVAGATVTSKAYLKAIEDALSP